MKLFKIRAKDWMLNVPEKKKWSHIREQESNGIERLKNNSRTGKQWRWHPLLKL